VTRGHDLDRYAWLGRRALLRGLGGAGLITASGLGKARGLWAQPVFSTTPFTLGVASGEPTSSGVVLWTRLAPVPYRGGGMPALGVEVAWEIAEDEAMARTAQRGTAVARPELGHALHVEVEGLRPAREYFYRFTVGGFQSPAGRTRTLPPLDAPVDRLRFAVVGCQRFEDGHYTAYADVARERFDFVFHYGDYIYEFPIMRSGGRPLPVVRVMPEPYGETETLEDYRNRYATYKSDPRLMAAHASAPFIVSYDDHEVDNNWAGDISEGDDDPLVFRLRKAAAFQAWYEHMPLRRAQAPSGADIIAYRRFGYGDLATLDVLDTRQFRTDQPCGDLFRDCAAAREPHRTMLGFEQERWLHQGFREHRRTWRVLAQQVLMAQLDRHPDPMIVETNIDKWDGAVAGRDRLFAALREARVDNAVVLTGDLHNSWAIELKENFDDPRSRTLGFEFVASSISTNGDGAETRADIPTLMAINPHVKYYNNRRGYARHIVDRRQWQVDFRAVERVSVAHMPVATRKSLVIEANSRRLAEP
jgi:alkaline phosphatase D